MADSATHFSSPTLDEVFQKRPDVFLSYSRGDKRVAEELAAKLADAGFEVWFDKDIQAGSDWRRTIETKVGRARCVLLVWSKRAEQSWWVAYEAIHAQRQEKLILTSFEDIGASSQSWAKDLQCRRLRRPLFKHFSRTEAWDQLIKEINIKRRRLPRFEFRGWLGGGVAHKDGATCVEFHPFEDNTLLSTGKDGRAIIWSTEAVAELKTRSQEEGDDVVEAAASPGGEFTFAEQDGRTLWKGGFSADGDTIFLASERGSCHVFRGRSFAHKLSELEQLKLLLQGFDPSARRNANNQFQLGVLDAAIGPDNTALVISGGRAVIWRLGAEPAPLHALYLPQMARGRSVDCAYSPASGCFFATDRQGGIHRIWPDGRLDANAFPQRRAPGAIMAHGRVSSRATSVGELMAIASTNPADPRVDVFEYDGSAYAKRNTREVRAEFPVRSLALHPESPAIVMASGYRPALFAYDEGERLDIGPGGHHSAPVSYVALSASGRFLASAGDDGCVGIWEDTLPR
ncbi:MAG: toll/interleukin-1 receptor domain-containing protein [Terricaulis sp.]